SFSRRLSLNLLKKSENRPIPSLYEIFAQMKYIIWFYAILLAARLSADPPNYVIATAAGYFPGATPNALQQRLVQPVIVAYDPNGNLYYGTNHQIWRLNPDATITLIAGNGSSDASHLGD